MTLVDSLGPMLDRRFAVAALLLCAAAPAHAQRDHLVPEGSPFEYAKNWPVGGPGDLTALYDRDVVARLIVEPSFRHVFGVGIRQGGDAYGIVAVEQRDATHVDKCERTLDKGLAVRAIAAWRIVLLATRFTEDEAGTPGLDGTTLHFSMMDKFDPRPGANGVVLYGQTWEPDEGSPPRLLYKVGVDLRDYCTTGDGADLKDASANLDRLLAHGKHE